MPNIFSPQKAVLFPQWSEKSEWKKNDRVNAERAENETVAVLSFNAV